MRGGRQQGLPFQVSVRATAQTHTITGFLITSTTRRSWQEPPEALLAQGTISVPPLHMWHCLVLVRDVTAHCNGWLVPSWTWHGGALDRQTQIATHYAVLCEVAASPQVQCKGTWQSTHMMHHKRSVCHLLNLCSSWVQGLVSWRLPWAFGQQQGSSDYSLCACRVAASEAWRISCSHIASAVCSDLCHAVSEHSISV